MQIYAKDKTNQQEEKSEEEVAAELAEDMSKYYSYEDPELLLIIKYTEPGKQHDLALEIYNNKQKVYALTREISELERYLGNLLSSSGGKLGDIGEQKQKELDKKKAEVAARKDAQAQLKKGTISSIDDYLESKYAITSGDPVKITTGSYVQNETDIKSTSLKIFKVNRDYDSNSRKVSSFGLGWTTNLDQRI